MKILFVAGFGPITRDIGKGSDLYSDALGIKFKEEEGGYLHTDGLEGCKSFALWPLSQAAMQCFGTETWPSDVPEPHAWLEFDVEDMEAATEELKEKNYKLIVANRKEPWGQVVTRFMDPDGLLVAVTYSPWLREKS